MVLDDKHTSQSPPLRASVSSAGSEVILQDKNIQTLSVTCAHVPTVNIKYVTQSENLPVSLNRVQCVCVFVRALKMLTLFSTSLSFMGTK